jgi:hypothetical protein
MTEAYMSLGWGEGPEEEAYISLPNMKFLLKATLFPTPFKKAFLKII